MRLPKKVHRLRLSILMAVFLAGLCACTTLGTLTPSTPSSGEIARFSGQWISGLIDSLAKNGAQAANTLCQAGVLTEKECGMAALGQALMPSIVGIAQAALGAFQADPNPASQAALQVAMAPVYQAAKAVNGP